jgi:hypothetical protein
LSAEPTLHVAIEGEKLLLNEVLENTLHYTRNTCTNEGVWKLCVKETTGMLV